VRGSAREDAERASTSWISTLFLREITERERGATLAYFSKEPEQEVVKPNESTCYGKICRFSEKKKGNLRAAASELDPPLWGAPRKNRFKRVDKGEV